MSPGQMSPWQLGCVMDGPRNLPLKFHQNRVSNSWDIPDMDKCRLDKCCLDKCHRDSWDVLRMVPQTYVQSLVKIGSVTAEIFPIWTNVENKPLQGGGGSLSSCLACRKSIKFRTKSCLLKSSLFFILLNLNLRPFMAIFGFILVILGSLNI